MVWTDIHPPSPLSQAPSLSRPSTSKSARGSPSTARPLPDYMDVNPLIYRTSTHSFTHSWPTHRLISCPRCSSSTRSSGRSLTSAHSHHRDDYYHHKPLSRSSTSSSPRSHRSFPWRRRRGIRSSSFFFPCQRSPSSSEIGVTSSVSMHILYLKHQNARKDGVIIMIIYNGDLWHISLNDWLTSAHSGLGLGVTLSYHNRTSVIP